jgi:hypothetical protein
VRCPDRKFLANRARLFEDTSALSRRMNSRFPLSIRAGTLLAINILFLILWGFAGLGKLIDGVPPWFEGKFGKTLFASFPGLTATFW